MFVFPRRLDQLSRFHRWVDLALLFKKGVGQEIAVLEVADNVFSNVQHSRNPVLKFCGRRTAGDLSQTWAKAPFCVQNFFLEAPSLQPGRECYTATTLWCSMAKATVAVVLHHEVSPRLAGQCGSEEKRVQANGSNLPVLLNKVAHLVAKACWSVRRNGDWKEIAKLKAKYSILDLPQPASAAAVSFVATLFAGVDLQGSDGRGVSQLPICADTLFFLLNECSLSQNECLWPPQTNFYQTFGRFVSALSFNHCSNFECWKRFLK